MNEKSVKKLKKIIPVSFIVLFAAFLVIPNTGLYRGEKNARLIAQTENRRITPRPTQSLKSKEFYTQFEKWYQDRLRYRDKAIKRWSELNIKIGVIVHPNIFYTNGGWLFHKDMIIKDFAEADKKIQDIRKLQDYCQNRSKYFLLFIPPSKESFYRELFPTELRKQYKDPSYWHRQGELLFKGEKINYLCVDKELKKEQYKRPYPLYLLGDSHWNHYGAAIATNLLLKNVFSKSQQYAPYSGLLLDGSKKSVQYGYDYFAMLGINKIENSYMPWSQYYKNIFEIDCYSNKKTEANNILTISHLMEAITKGELIYVNNKAPNNFKILILGDSYSTFMLPYITQFANMTVITHYNACVERKQKVDINYLLNKYQPDYVILEIVDRVFYPNTDDFLFNKLIY